MCGCAGPWRSNVILGAWRQPCSDAWHGQYSGLGETRVGLGPLQLPWVQAPNSITVWTGGVELPGRGLALHSAGVHGPGEKCDHLVDWGTWSWTLDELLAVADPKDWGRCPGMPGDWTGGVCPHLDWGRCPRTWSWWSGVTNRHLGPGPATTGIWTGGVSGGLGEKTFWSTPLQSKIPQACPFGSG